MPTTSASAATAALSGDPARADMLTALMDGRALTATELAHAAGITPQIASAHLAQLTEAGLLAMERQGRHRYHRLASIPIAPVLERIMCRRTAPVVGPRDPALRRARTCYNHLAGQLAVAMVDRMMARGELELSQDGGALTPAGTAFLRSLGVKFDGAGMSCRPCLDWSERRPHLAGRVGTALCQACFANGWIRRVEGTRAVTVTPSGQQAFQAAFQLAQPIQGVQAQ